MEAAERGEFTHTFNSPAELMAYLNAPEPPVDMFQFTSLFATSTNLPVTFWISVQGFVTTDSHDPSASNPPEVKQWIELNRDALLAHWRGELDSAELVNICANYPWVTNSHIFDVVILQDPPLYRVLGERDRWRRTDAGCAK